MITKYGNQLERARKAFAAFFKPCTTKYIELEDRAGKESLKRIQLAVTGDGVFQVTQLEYKYKLLNAEVSSSAKKAFAHQHLALNYIDELTTQLELSGHDVVDEQSFEYVDASKLPFKAARPEPREAVDFFRQYIREADSICVQKIAGGLQVIVAIDAMGRALYRTVDDTQFTQLGDSSAKFSLEMFCHLPGFRGAIFEAFFSLSGLKITDVIYFNNQFMTEAPIHERFATLKAACTSLGIPDTLLLEPQTLLPREWLSINNLGTCNGMLMKRTEGSNYSAQEGIEPSPGALIFTGCATNVAVKEYVTTNIGKRLRLMDADSMKNLAVCDFPELQLAKYAEFNMVGYHPNSKLCPVLF